MEEDDKGCPMIRLGVSGWVFFLVPAYPGCPGQKSLNGLCVYELTTWDISFRCTIMCCAVFCFSSRYGRRLWLVLGRFIGDAAKAITKMTWNAFRGYATKCCMPTTIVPLMTSICQLHISHTYVNIGLMAVLQVKLDGWLFVDWKK